MAYLTASAMVGTVPVRMPIPSSPSSAPFDALPRMPRTLSRIWALTASRATVQGTVDVVEAQNTGSASIVRPSGLQLRAIESLYRVPDRSRVLGFLEDHAYLVPVLVEASEHLRVHFDGASLVLRTVTDPEEENVEDATELVLSVVTPLEPADALSKLAAFEDAWWLGVVPQAQGKLCIDLDYQ